MSGTTSRAHGPATGRTWFTADLHLVAGNHDRCWEGHGARATGSAQTYRDAGFATIRTSHVVELAGRRVLLHHFPYEGDSHDDDRYVQWRPVDEGDWLLHGHVHTTWRQNGRMIYVGVDIWDLAPVAEETLVALITETDARSGAATSTT